MDFEQANEENRSAQGDGRLAGTFADLATVSFCPVHHMTMGEAGPS